VFSIGNVRSITAQSMSTPMKPTLRDFKVDRNFHNDDCIALPKDADMVITSPLDGHVLLHVRFSYGRA
jgi:hypothetical protein